MSDARFDVVVVGAGIIGLAVARELQARQPGLRLAVLDKEPTLGAHQTGHASGVVHRGVYYVPGSLKAKLCVEGAARLLVYCEERGIPVLRCGKVVVATNEDELPRLEELHRRSVANGVPHVELIDRSVCARSNPTSPASAQCTRRRPPSSTSPGRPGVRTGRDGRGRRAPPRPGGALVHRRTARRRSDHGRDVEASRVVVCAGVYADRLAASTGATPSHASCPSAGTTSSSGRRSAISCGG